MERSHNRVMTLRAELEMVVDQVREFCQSLDDEQVNWSPEAGTWTAGQCIDHLTITARKFGAAIDESVANSQRKGWIQRGASPRPPLWGRLFLRIMDPPVGRFKVKASAPFLPDAGRPAAIVLSEFLDAHENLLRNWTRWLQADLVRTRVRGPFPIRFPLILVMHILPAHARRHLWQAQQLLRAARSSRGIGIQWPVHKLM